MRRPQQIRKYIVYAVYLLLITTIQVTFRGWLNLYGIRPDMMFVFVVLTAYMFGFYDGIVVGALVGIIRDYFSAPTVTGLDGTVTNALGIGLFVMVAAAAYGSAFFTVRVERNFILAFLSVVTATLLYKSAGHLLIFIWSHIVPGLSYNMELSQVLLKSILPQILMNFIIAIPIYLLLRFAGPYKGGVNTVLVDEKRKGEQTWLTM
jgi:cell shape-determining protein MreD